MKIDELPKWMHVIPTLLGAGLAVAGMYAFPLLGLRNTLGVIVGLPLGTLVGVGIMLLIAKRRVA